MLHVIIAALIFPIPFVHLWLHALLPTWRRYPWLFYLFGALVFVGAFTFVPFVAALSPRAFIPTSGFIIMGETLMLLGAIAVLSSILTLGPARFFVWAVLKSHPSHTKVHRGPFRIWPHPAYTGYLLVALGNLFMHGYLYLGGVLALLLAFTPIVIYLEEHEMRERLHSS